MKIIGSLIIVLTLGAAPARVFADEANLEKAHQLYKEGKYSEAGALYEQALGQFPGSSELHYNLGNVYVKLKRIGEAVAEYEKARLGQPRDYEINGNLAYVQGLIQYRVDDKRNWYWVQWLKVLELISWTEIFFASAGLYFVFILLLILRLLFRGRPGIRKGAQWAWAFFLLSLFPLATKYWDVFLHRDAVVVREKAEVRYGPSGSDKVAFRLAPGLKVNVLDSREDWFLVGLVNGESGWCEKKNLEVI